MPTLEPAIYSHLDTESGRGHEEYALLTHGKTEIGASSVDVKPTLSSHGLVCKSLFCSSTEYIIICAASLCYYEPVCSKKESSS